jgi:hypothetical protein
VRRNRKAACPFVCDARQVGAGVDRYRQRIEVLAIDRAAVERRTHLVDVDGGHENVVADRRLRAVCEKEHARLTVPRQRQHPLDDRIESGYGF